MTRRKRVGGNVTLHPAVAPNHFDGLRVSPRPCCSVAFKATVKRAATTSGGKITVTCLNSANCPQRLADFYRRWRISLRPKFRVKDNTNGVTCQFS